MLKVEYITFTFLQQRAVLAVLRNDRDMKLPQADAPALITKKCTHYKGMDELILQNSLQRDGSLHAKNLFPLR